MLGEAGVRVFGTLLKGAVDTPDRDAKLPRNGSQGCSRGFQTGDPRDLALTPWGHNPKVGGSNPPPET